MAEQELMKAVLVRINQAVGGDTLMNVLIEGLYREFPGSTHEQIQVALEQARQRGLIWVLVGAVGLTKDGVKHAEVV